MADFNLPIHTECSNMIKLAQVRCNEAFQLPAMSNCSLNVDETCGQAMIKRTGNKKTSDALIRKCFQFYFFIPLQDKPTE